MMFEIRWAVAMGALGLAVPMLLAEAGSEVPLGTWRVSPERLISGEQTPIELRYSNGMTALPSGSYFEFDLEPLSVKALVHTPASTDFMIVSCGDQLPKVEIQKGKLTGVGYFSGMRLSLPEGLQPGQRFALRMGNRSQEGVVGLVTPIPVHGLAFNMQLVFPDGRRTDWFKQGWCDALPHVDIEGGSASALRIFAPSLVKKGSAFRVRIAVTDTFDARCYPEFLGRIPCEALEGVDGLPKEFVFQAGDRSGKGVEGVRISKSGVYRITAQLNGKLFESNPIVVRDEITTPIYWGMLHSHNRFSEGWGDGPREHYRFARDVSGMDFAGLSDHRGTVPDDHPMTSARLLPYRTGRTWTTRETWLDAQAAADEYDEDGRFAALLGYEFADESCSHYVVYWDRLNKTNYDRLWPKSGPVFQSQLDAVLAPLDALMIPHAHATYVPYSEWNTGRTRSGHLLMPAIEVNSDWGMAFPGYGTSNPLLGGGKTDIAASMPSVIARGYKVGVIGDSDNHEGLPGRRVQVAISPGHAVAPQGLTAVPAKALTRRDILAGYRTRATYATSGERIFLDVALEGQGMGCTVKSDSVTKLRVQICGTDVIEAVHLWTGTGITETKTIGSERDVDLTFDIPVPLAQEIPYFIEVIQRNHHRAWSSPVWIGRKAAPASASVVSVIGPAPGNPAGPVAQIQLRRWNNRRITVSYYYKGPRVTQTVMLSGVADYLVEPNRGQWWHGTQKNDKTGKIEFTNAGGRVPSDDTLTRSEWRGLDITFDVDPDRPCSIRVVHDGDFKTYIGNKVVSGTKVEVDLTASGKTEEPK